MVLTHAVHPSCTYDDGRHQLAADRSGQSTWANNSTGPGRMGRTSLRIQKVRPLVCVAAGDNPQRVRSEAAWTHLCGVAPLGATSGKVTRRHRLNRGGNRQANHALWRIVFTRFGSDARTRTYVARRLDQGPSRAEIIRSLKRYVARETYRHLPR
jgi:hypothetical protein